MEHKKLSVNSTVKQYVCPTRKPRLTRLAE
jgi:hypothetical protein